MNETQTLLVEIESLKARIKELENQIKGVYINPNEI